QVMGVLVFLHPFQSTLHPSIHSFMLGHESACPDFNNYLSPLPILFIFTLCLAQLGRIRL
ncbi:MAG: hypothetical protein ABW168_17580, partial [Sedimenticola sp.]